MASWGCFYKDEKKDRRSPIKNSIVGTFSLGSQEARLSADVNEIADKMVPGRAGPEPTYAPRVIARMLLPTSDDISPQVSAETGDETPDDTYAKDPPLNEAGKEVMTTRNKVAAGFVRRSWDPHFEIQRDEKPFTEEELACE